MCETSKTVLELKLSDENCFKLKSTIDEREVGFTYRALLLSELFANMLSCLNYIPKKYEEEEAFPVAIEGEILVIIEIWCRRHRNDKKETLLKNTLSEWDVEFMNSLSNTQLSKLITAASYIDCEGLLHMACVTVVNKTRGKTTEEMRVILGIKQPPKKEDEDDGVPDHIRHLKSSETMFKSVDVVQQRSRSGSVFQFVRNMANNLCGRQYQ